jgi:ligand-binding sensor protein
MKIRDFCDLNELNGVLRNWSEATGMSNVVLDGDGQNISEEIGKTDFCMKLTRSTEEGCRRCERCNREGRGVYYCHAGLMDFSVDIVVNGEVLGKVVGGQVLPHEPDEQKFKAIAREIGVNPDDYYEAAKRVEIRPESSIRAAAGLLGDMVNMFVNSQYMQSRNEHIVEALNTNIESAVNLLKSINDKSKALDKIESKQRILALNASIEAGRAGEAGKGFAVVANEVGNLAVNSGEVNKSIKSALKDLTSVMGQLEEASIR